MESPDWTEINAGIQQHLQKAYNTNKAAFKAHHWFIDPTTGTYNVEKIRRERPENITTSEYDKYIEFWNDPRNIARAAQNRQNRAKSTVISRQGCRLQPPRSTRRSLTHSSWHTLLTGNSFGMRTDVYTEGTLSVWVGYCRHGPASPSTPVHDSTLNSLHKKVDFMMSIFKSNSKYSDMFSQFESDGASGSGGCEDEEEGADHQDDEDEDGDDDT
nr:hypothetical protein [Tanacetum cinerariifolium]